MRPRSLYVNVAAVSPSVLPAASYEYVRAGVPVIELSRLLVEDTVYVPLTVPVAVSVVREPLGQAVARPAGQAIQRIVTVGPRQTTVRRVRDSGDPERIVVA